MKICPECHKISKDDDFCSHCGAAVFGFDNYSESARCNDYSGHDHSKITFDRTERGTKIRDREKLDEMANTVRSMFLEGTTPPTYPTQMTQQKTDDHMYKYPNLYDPSNQNMYQQRQYMNNMRNKSASQQKIAVAYTVAIVIFVVIAVIMGLIGDMM
ncbi:MAG: zinc ribbon domain-containing protein [Oscillospiraceae bacterium]|nr:zinc ribbon domain-containing protein [Oscillospiraceae bacterium]